MKCRAERLSPLPWVACGLALAACAGAPPPRPVADHKTPPGDPIEVPSLRLKQNLLVLPGVFPPQEAEMFVLPFMEDHRDLFAGKRVFEIGTGSGVISLYAAQLGAAQVVCSDISPNAIASVRLNAERMGFSQVIDARLVPQDDQSAYSVLKPGETFDVLISNPPYSLDLDADYSTALVDRGDLGFSIVRGLEQRLTPGGVAALFYNSLFYHGVMVNFARYEGYAVRTHGAMGEAPWALEALCNHYLARLLEREGLPANAFRFYKEELPFATAAITGDLPPLVGDAKPSGKRYSGFLTIQRKP